MGGEGGGGHDNLQSKQCRSLQIANVLSANHIKKGGTHPHAQMCDKLETNL